MSTFIKQADGSYGDVDSISAKVVDDTEDFSVSSAAAPPVYCEDLTSESECLTQGCYWYDGSCHSVPPGIVCSNYTSESTCVAAGCFWYDGACHGTPKPEEVEIPWHIVLAAVGGVIAIIGAVVLIKR